MLGWREAVLARFLGGGWAVGGILAGWWASTWVFLVVSLYLFAMCYLYGFLLGFPYMAKLYPVKAALARLC